MAKFRVKEYEDDNCQRYFRVERKDLFFWYEVNVSGSKASSRAYEYKDEQKAHDAIKKFINTINASKRRAV